MHQENNQMEDLTPRLSVLHEKSHALLEYL